METKLIVAGMSCQNCVKHVKHALDSIAGVSGSIVDLEAGTAFVTHDDVGVETLVAALEEEGYDARAA